MFSDGPMWIIQGIEQDICTQGRTKEAAVDRFGKTVMIERALGVRLRTNIRPAPDRFERMWLESITDFADAEHNIRVKE